MASGDEKEWRVVTTDRSSHTGQWSQWSQWSLVKVMLDAGLLMMFASWHLPSARHHQPVRAVSACQHQTEKLCEFLKFWHRYTSIFTIFRILRVSSFLLIRPSIWRGFADNYLKFRRKDYVQKTFENSALWYLEVWSAMLSTRKRCKEAFSEYWSTLSITVTIGEL